MSREMDRQAGAVKLVKELPATLNSLFSLHNARAIQEHDLRKTDLFHILTLPLIHLVYNT